MTNKEKEKTHFWINTYGECVYFSNYDSEIGYPSFHYEIACREFPNEKDPEDKLMDLGWIKVGSVVYHVPYSIKEPTQAQIDTLFDLKLLKNYRRELCIVI